MGLDITAMRGLQQSADGHFTIYENPDFPGRAEGLVPGMTYTYEARMGFRAGSYSGYSAWRAWLAQLAGYASPEDVTGPFAELINFSDCEGTIGPVVAARLLQDFIAFDEAAQATDDDEGGWYYQKYQEWHAAMAMAADGGAVVFH